MGEQNKTLISDKDLSVSVAHYKDVNSAFRSSPYISLLKTTCISQSQHFTGFLQAPFKLLLFSGVSSFALVYFQPWCYYCKRVKASELNPYQYIIKKQPQKCSVI